MSHTTLRRVVASDTCCIGGLCLGARGNECFVLVRSDTRLFEIPGTAIPTTVMGVDTMRLAMHLVCSIDSWFFGAWKGARRNFAARTEPCERCGAGRPFR